MIIGKIFNKYDVDFPEHRDLIIITGMNGTGKTKTLELASQYFKDHGENVLYFPADRRLTITQDEFDKSSVMAQLSGADNIWSIITESYDIFDPLFWNFHQTGQWITDGTSQIYNFFFSIFSDHRKDLVVMIDSIERNLHVLVLRKIIRDITGLKKVKKLIVVTHSPEVVGEWWDNTYDIKKIVDIYADKC